jgi:hypothetical protein
LLRAHSLHDIAHPPRSSRHGITWPILSKRHGPAEDERDDTLQAAVHLKGVPDHADTVAKDGSLVVTVGRPVEGRITLIETKKEPVPR